MVKLLCEMASASGLHLVPRQQRNPRLYYLWNYQLIKAALDKGAKHLVIVLVAALLMMAVQACFRLLLVDY